MSNPPPGELFSRIYLERGKPSRDSQRFRARLAAFVQEKLRDWLSLVARDIERELGVVVPRMGAGLYAKAFFAKAELRDVLDSVTLIYRAIMAEEDRALAGEWLSFVARVFHEENIGYRVDGNGVVHFHIDEEFERNRQYALQCLNDPRFGGVAHAFEAAYARLDTDPTDTRGAVRNMFEALETLAKVISNSNQDLDGRFVHRTLTPVISRVYQTMDRTAQSTAEQLLQSFIDWVNAMHKYRHGHNEPEPVAPPLDLAVLALSQGTSYVRWLVGVDQMAAQVRQHTE